MANVCSADSDIAGYPFRPVRVVTFSSLFPNAAQPTHGVFVENRLRHLVASGRVVSEVIAPVPWFPAVLRNVRGYDRFLGVPAVETRWGLRVRHPRFPVVPKVGMTVAPALLFARSLPAFRRLQKESGDFDLIDAHYFYPDGVAAVMIGKMLRKPVVITARGTDINLIPRHRLPRRMILFAARHAAGVIAVSQSLKDELIALGIPAARVTMLRNGVDLGMFRPIDRVTARSALRFEGPTLASVGGLIERKGHHLVIGALQHLPQHSLAVVGEGPELKALQHLSVRLGVANRVRFFGRIAHEELPRIYSAADALVLASSREGWPNVLLEAMACGTPVVASNVWGNPEIVTRPEAGRLMPDRSAAGVATAVKELFNELPDRAKTRRYAEGFSWDHTTDGQIRLFSEILMRRG